ncbi:hypothetical protein MRB53_017163 [Persea americana]|uniref:Uncharacterized protein n=1 Tax=Persea americana TaxID=3435 RepID=A0ACC2M567_PERAE|nr:hypothetical protein MRB53_017163 [Persea americana]
MSMALEHLKQQPPPVSVSGSRSFGPVIAILVVITLLGIIAVLIGRLCTGRKIMGRFQFNVEGWIEKHCSACISGNSQTPGTNANDPEASVPIPISEGNNQQINPPEQSSQGPRPTGGA